MSSSAAPSKWHDLARRTVSALVLGGLALAALLRGGVAWSLFVLALVGILSSEWATLARQLHPGQRPVFFSLGQRPIFFSLGPRPIFLALGLPYIALPAAALLWLRHRATTGRDDVLLLLIIVWATDIGGYLAGRAIGGPRLAPRISPGKTISGAIGGLLAAILTACLFTLIIAPHSPIPILAHIALIAALLSIASALGDLLESGWKRALGVKDSGRAIPGHGGAFDRLDGLLLAAPLAALLTLIGAGTAHGLGFAPWL